VWLPAWKLSRVTARDFYALCSIDGRLLFDPDLCEADECEAIVVSWKRIAPPDELETKALLTVEDVYPSKTIEMVLAT
jgi:hypothetical protein